MTALSRIVRNRGTEKDVRDYLQDNGFQGPSARFDYLELKAIQRPGWVQVFKFSVRVMDDKGDLHRLLGVTRDDERKSIEVFLAEDEAEIDRVLAEWSAGLITLRQERSTLTPLFLAIFGFMILVVIAGAMVSS